MSLLNADTKKLIQSFVDESRSDLVKVIDSNNKKFPTTEFSVTNF